MKQLIQLLIIVLAFTNTRAQTSPEQMSVTIQNLYNQQEAGKLYDLTNKGFQTKISKSAFENALMSQLFPYGKITRLEPLGLQGSVYRYKCLLDKGAVLQMAMGIDSEGKLHTLGFQPWKEPVSTKKEAIWHDNALLTPTDSLVHRAAEKYLKENNTPGLAIGILMGTKAFFYNYGLARPATNQHPTPQMIYEIGSITKTFTAFLLADAVVAKKARLEDPISLYLPDSVASNKQLEGITLLQLANHTSGLPRLPDNYLEGSANHNDPYAHYALNHLYKFLKKVKPATKPGSSYAYSNLGFGLLGIILEKIYGQPLQILYQEKIFKPLKMVSSFATSITDSSMAATPTDAKGNPTNYWNFNAMAGAGAIKSNTTDLLRYGMAFALKPRTNGRFDERVLLAEKISFSNETVKLGLGWHFSKTEDADAIMDHSGGTGGFKSYLGILSGRQMAVIVLANCAEEPGPPLFGRRLMEELKAGKQNPKRL